VVVFEHERIRVGQDVDGQELTQRQFDAIARWKERTNHPGLEIGHHSIRTSQWVGVLQVGRTTIEILPKADARRGQENLDRRQLVQHWKFVLLDMLAALKGFDLHASSRAQLHLQSHTLLDIFFNPCCTKDWPRLTGMWQRIAPPGVVDSWSAKTFDGI
jgi:5-methylcytosine-specific restriction enzyme subunit McrC